MAGIKKILYKFPNENSRGEQQRVAIVRALLPKPLVVLADEPISCLDKQNKLIIASLLKKFNQKFGQTIIMTTHDEMMAGIASRIIRFTDGKIKSDSKNA